MHVELTRAEVKNAVLAHLNEEVTGALDQEKTRKEIRIWSDGSARVRLVTVEDE